MIDKHEWDIAKQKLKHASESPTPVPSPQPAQAKLLDETAVLAKQASDRLEAAEANAELIRQQAAAQAAAIRKEAMKEAAMLEEQAKHRLRLLEEEANIQDSASKMELQSSEAVIHDQELAMKAATLAAAKSKQLLSAKKEAEQRALEMQHRAEEEAAVTILKVM